MNVKKYMKTYFVTIEEKDLTEARQFWWDTRDHRAAVSKFPRSSYIERNILYGLCDQDSDYMGALNKVGTYDVLLTTIKSCILGGMKITGFLKRKSDYMYTSLYA